MAEYKCISCGAVKESKKTCSCPTCGYKMFELPYERFDVLRREIRHFLFQLRLSKITYDRFSIFRRVPKNKNSETGKEQYIVISKNEDDNRFPGFSRIQDYVCSSTKAEMFYERLKTSIEQIKKYIHEPYANEYCVSLHNIKTEIQVFDSVLKESVNELGISFNVPAIDLPEIKLEYRETLNDELLGISDTILEDLVQLSEKIKLFIKRNNIYGIAYRDKPKNAYKPPKGNDHVENLNRYGTILKKVLAKQYTVDIFSDGSEELNEMLKALWSAIEAIMKAPVLVKKFTYTFSDGLVVIDDEVNKVLLERINARYSDFDRIVNDNGFLSDKSDDQLFEIYDKLIELDTFGFLGINKTVLLKIGESEKKLKELIGLDDIKESIKKIKAYALANKGSDDLNIHMCFLGNPGSGKTEVARQIAGILYENKILPSNRIVEVDRSGLVSQYVGETAIKTMDVIQEAMGGVLFVDEAYSLVPKESGFDYGSEAVATLIKAMEDYRGKFCVILAGYKNEMLQMLSTNPGFRSRIQFTLDFPNYSRDELKDITELMLKSRNYTIDSGALNRILDITDVKRKDPNFANAREIRNILDQVIMCQNVRCAGTDEREIGIVDVNKYIHDAKINLPTTGDGLEKKVLTSEEELDRLIGLEAVKHMIKKIKAYAKRNKGDADFNLHMCFYGNPGTGKTEVARILSKILYDAGVLGEAKLVETDGQGLLGKYVGETAPKTKAKIDDAMNGVLFIDEAYSIVDSGSFLSGGATNYGDEAIAVLLKEMEDHRGQFCVILAGYKSEMKKMLSTNPGFESRIQFTIEFPDYTREELGKIARLILEKKKYIIEDKALDSILDITDYYREQPNFANARTVRNILDRVLMNQNLRTENSNDNLVALSDVEEYLIDEKINLDSPNSYRSRIGFL